jgi:hypothetical protein
VAALDLELLAFWAEPVAALDLELLAFWAEPVLF